MEATKYKDSGIPWIGMIPSDWFSPKLKFYVEICSGEAITNELLKDEGKYEVWGGGNGIMGYYDNYNIDEECLVIGRVGACGFVKRSTEKKFITDNALILKLISNTISFNYLYHTLISADLSKLNTSTAQPLITATKVKNIHIPLPSPPTQQRIADYLDRKCAEIDELAALQETMIAELKRYKQSVITEAVTKGLDPNVPMKESGVEWIGKIPSHWEMKAIKYVLQRRNQKNDPIISEERLSLSIGIGITKYADKTTNLDRYKDDFTQYQLAYPNDIVLNSMNMIVGAVGKSDYLGCVSPVYYVMIPKNSIESTYYSYLLNNPRIRDVYHSLGKGIYAIERGEGRVNTCRLKVSFYDFGRIAIPVPSTQEQKQINEFLQRKCAEIDELIAIKQQKIEALKEYKKSVIFEYVTGKKEVLGFKF